MIRLSLKVVAGASRDRILGWVGDRLKIAVTAPPERGRANRAVLDLLAVTLGLPRSRVRLVSGEASPRKGVEVDAPAELVGERLPAR